MAADGDIPGPTEEDPMTQLPVGAVATAVVTSTTTSTAVVGTSANTVWTAVSARKIADRAALLAQRPDWQLEGPLPADDVLDVSQVPTSQLSAREREIVDQDATSLVAALRERRYSAFEVAEAFCRVATAAQALTNCLTEVFFGEALQRAAELDRHLHETGEVVGPLHGLPVSIKDHILVQGHDTATGYAAWAYRTKATKDAVAVDILRRAGAVLYVKTANPQTLLVGFSFLFFRSRRLFFFLFSSFTMRPSSD